MPALSSKEINAILDTEDLQDKYLYPAWLMIHTFEWEAFWRENACKHDPLWDI